MIFISKKINKTPQKSDLSHSKSNPTVHPKQIKSALKSNGLGGLATMFGSLLSGVSGSDNSKLLKQYDHMILNIINNQTLSDHQKLIIIKNTLSK